MERPKWILVDIGPQPSRVAMDIGDEGKSDGKIWKYPASTGCSSRTWSENATGFLYGDTQLKEDVKH